MLAAVGTRPCIDASTDISASRSCGGTLPGVSAIVAMKYVGALAVLGDDQVHVGGHVTVQPKGNLVLAQRLDRLLDVDLVPVDVDAVLSLQRRGHVLVGDGPKGF